MGIRRASIGLAVFLVVLIQLVGVVNIIGYPSREYKGTGISFNNTRPKACVRFKKIMTSVLFEKCRPSEDCNVYRHRLCGPICSFCNLVRTRPSGATCFRAGHYWSASFQQVGCGQTSVVEDVPSSEASQFEVDFDTVEPSQLQSQNATGIVYTEDRTKRHWILTTPSALELFDAMESLPECEKSAWLQARGATFMANADGQVEFE